MTEPETPLHLKQVPGPLAFASTSHKITAASPPKAPPGRPWAGSQHDVAQTQKQCAGYESCGEWLHRGSCDLVSRVSSKVTLLISTHNPDAPGNGVRV